METTTLEAVQGLEPRPATAGSARADRRRAAVRGLWTLLLAMSPAILLGAVYPIASSRMAGHSVGGVPVSVLIISVSVAVPWLSQVCCTPVYRLVAAAMGDGPEAVTRAFARIWPDMLLRAVGPSAVVTLLIAAVTGWSATAIAAQAVLTMENMLFVQSLIVADLAGRRRRWALGWAAYALAVLIVPAAWWLPPALGAISQVAFMGSGLAGALHPALLEPRGFARDMARGLILGGVLWADKLLLFLTEGTHWNLTLAYLCLQPAVLAYTFYFAITCPRINRSLEHFQAKVETSCVDSLHELGQALRRQLLTALGLTGAVAAAGVAIVVIGTAIVAPGKVLAVAVISVGSVLLAALTLLCYEIDHSGRASVALALSGAHLVAAIAAFTLIGGLVPSFAATAAADVLLVSIAGAAYRTQWASPEYSFFWGKAVAW